MSTPRLGWYGDDFTGASDTLAELSRAGLRALLFLGVPSAPQLQAAAGALGGPLDAVGIAGAARAMRPDAMACELAPVGEFFARLAPPVLHYKVCSTFDSAPDQGSIGAAVRALHPHVQHPWIPIVGGQPSLGRYCVFSNLFAAAGRCGIVERLDRHPTMSLHPATPMGEADLRRHLARQGLEAMTAVHYPRYQQQDSALEEQIGQGGAMLLDVAQQEDLAVIGRLLWREAARGRLLAVGASSVAQALVAHWRAVGVLRAQAAQPPLARASAPVLVFAGSLSPVTARQVQAAASFQHIALQPSDLFDAGAACARIVDALAAGRHVLATTAPGQPQQAGMRATGEIAAASAILLRRVLDARAACGAPLGRLGIAGGDTSSLATQALGIWGMSYRGSLGPGVAVTRTHSDDPARDGIELMLKGGQMGAEDVFEQLLRGTQAG
jgi:uncharacterized protein YgbK (DUF1537 family)